MTRLDLTREDLRTLFEQGCCVVQGVELRFRVNDTERAEAANDIALSHPMTCTCDDTLHLRGFGCL